jgi:ribosome-binding factor A
MSRRTDRINVLLQEEISRLVQMDLRDPRLNNIVTITRAAVSPDLQYAKVWVSALGGDQAEREALTALRSAASFLRRELARRLQLRHIPELQFIPDVITREGDHVLSLLDSIHTQETPDKNDS